MDQVIIDVRERSEFDAEHVAGSICLPLSNFNQSAPAILSTLGRTLQGDEILLMCRSGRRAEMARQEAARFAPDAKVVVFRGGIEEWKKQGKPTTVSGRSPLPILRQMQLTAGTMALTGAILALTLDIRWALLSAFVGGGLMMAGATGFCPMVTLLSKLPWNRTAPSCEIDAATKGTCSQ